MQKELKDNEATKKFLESLPDIYLVVCWCSYGILKLKFSGEFIFDAESNKYIPLVYQYYDGNGTCSKYILTNIYYTTTGSILGWTFDEQLAKAVIAK